MDLLRRKGKKGYSRQIKLHEQRLGDMKQLVTLRDILKYPEYFRMVRKKDMRVKREKGRGKVRKGRRGPIPLC